MIRCPGPLALAALAISLLACERAREEAEPAPVPLDSLTAQEEEQFAVDPTRFPEMQDGRLDTVDMRAEVPTGEGDIGAWHVQVVNYAPSHIAMTYAFWYTGPDSAANFAADRQPRLIDDEGNVYEGLVVPDNPRLMIERRTTGVGVYVFQPPLAQGADSLTLTINDSTAPVIRVGPWGVYHTPADTAGRIEVQPEN